MTEPQYTCITAGESLAVIHKGVATNGWLDHMDPGPDRRAVVQQHPWRRRTRWSRSVTRTSASSVTSNTRWWLSTTLSDP